AVLAAEVSRRGLVKTTAIGGLAMASSAFTLPFTRIANAAEAMDSSASRLCGKSKNKTNKAYKMKKVVVLSAVAAAVMMAGAANA
ncbi:twin-arginine translocation signal domain-containing protein, partial [Salmonella enterica subsp. enterica serovar Virginia]|nr:twin-arginine translocation signal domain-containing protein [Salmonella enterica subsp. enterica serovar Virginia]